MTDNPALAIHAARAHFAPFRAAPAPVAGALFLAAGQGLTLLRRVLADAKGQNRDAGIRWPWLALRSGA